MSHPLRIQGKKIIGRSFHTIDALHETAALAYTMIYRFHIKGK